MHLSLVGNRCQIASHLSRYARGFHLPDQVDDSIPADQAHYRDLVVQIDFANCGGKVPPACTVTVVLQLLVSPLSSVVVTVALTGFVVKFIFGL